MTLSDPHLDPLKAPLHASLRARLMLSAPLMILFVLSLSLLSGCDSAEPPPSGGVNNPSCDLEGEAMCGVQCVNTLYDDDHCGGCDQACPQGFVCLEGVCDRGGCGLEQGERLCGETCVDTQTDAQHCGACNLRCAEGARCSGGECLCAAGLTACVEGCVNLMVDANNCGSCLNACAVGQRCLEGSCVASREEVCDGQDNDLDGVIDEDKAGGPLRFDCSTLCGSGERLCEGGSFSECDAPQGSEELCDSSDNDCDGLVDEGLVQNYYEDVDGDGYGSPDLSVARASCAPPNTRGPNGGQYVLNSSDCNDNRADVFPTAPELCDAVDNNCDGTVDEGCGCAPGERRVCGVNVGTCRTGEQSCESGVYGACGGDSYVAPRAERCDAQDEDCDGVTDEGLSPDAYERAELEGPSGELIEVPEGANDRCEGARALPASESGEPSVSVQGLSLYRSAGVDGSGERDIDWFTIKSTDAFLGLCVPSRPQCLTLTLELEHPARVEPNDYQVCLTVISDLDDACVPAQDETAGRWCVGGESPSPEASYDAQRRLHTLTLPLEGVCGADDSRLLSVEVSSPRGVNDCAPYSLRFHTSLTNEACE